MWPSLYAETTGLGGALDIELQNGEEGVYVLWYGLAALAAPVTVLSPPAWHGLLLDPTSLIKILDVNAFSSAVPVSLSLPVPSEPLLGGLTIYFQAICQQGFIGPGISYSFTNLDSIVLASAPINAGGM